MRCTKCGYISFDKVETCSKCAAFLADVSGQISGTTQKVVAPFFLASVLGDVGGQALVEDDQDVFAAQESEFDLSVDEESDVPSIDLSQFDEEQGESVDEEMTADFELDMDSGDEADEDESIDFQLEEEAESEPQAERVEEDDEFDGGIDFELEGEEEEPAAVELEEQAETLPEIDEEGGLDLELDPESELSLNEPAVEESEPEPEPEGGISLDLDVELEDEPAEDEMVFNLEDIDMSDLVIEEGASQEDESLPTGEDAALDLEDFLADGGDGAADLQLDDIPMDLSLEDGELFEGDSSKGQEEESQDVPEVEL